MGKIEAFRRENGGKSPAFLSGFRTQYPSPFNVINDLHPFGWGNQVLQFKISILDETDCIPQQKIVRTVVIPQRFQFFNGYR
jgi:hypothetical protein